jgi:hypothetical protein
MCCALCTLCCICRPPTDPSLMSSFLAASALEPSSWREKLPLHLQRHCPPAVAATCIILTAVVFCASCLQAYCWLLCSLPRCIPFVLSAVGCCARFLAGRLPTPASCPAFLAASALEPSSWREKLPPLYIHNATGHPLSLRPASY